MAAVSKRLIIVGGGPAGMMAGLLFARAGVETLVLEKHGDFLRDFRGDTVHPSTLALFRELGLIEGLLGRPHDKVSSITGKVAGKDLRIADFSHLPVIDRFVAMMPQWEFLDFVVGQARNHRAFSVRMNAQASGVTFDQKGRVDGVTLSNGERLPADLVIAADGRRSVLRDAAALPLLDLGAPMDVFWFRLPKHRDEDNHTTGIFDAGRILVLIDRGDYWQMAYVFAKGEADAVRARGLPAFRAEIVRLAGDLAPNVEALQDWEDVKLLSVALDRLTRWHRPGLLAIGDAAHAMSPVGGVGINLAVQDAVAAANILAAPLAAGENVDALLGVVQARRMFPTRVIQGVQKIAHDRIIGALLQPDARLERPPLALRLLDRFPLLQRIPARLIGLGVRREHIRSPDAGTI